MTGPSLDDLLASMRVVSIPMRVQFRGVTQREVALIEGPVGWGEFGPFLEYAPPEASRWLASAVEAAWVGWPEPVRHSIPVNATVPAVAPDAVPAVLQRFPGTTTAKVKVAERGQSTEDDVCRVAAVRDAIGPHARVRIDANGAWDVATATDALRRLAAYDIEYAEQPCASVEELRDLRIALARHRISIPIAADESIRKAADPMRVRDLKAADLVVIKAAPLGGVQHALEIVAECGLPAVVSSALETSIGMASGLALAAALPQLDHACGLGTVALLVGDVTTDSLTPVDGALAVRRVSADPELLDRYAAEPGRVQWWRARVTSAWSHLAT
ncbi:MAG: o-succinylbenzoate synthase [Knoellia sp.]